MAKIILKVKKNRGFVILFAVTLAALLLSIALGVANIALKEIKFGTSARDTNDAFFAADSGVEKALFNDKTTGFYPTGSSTNLIVSGLGSAGQSCANVTVDKTASPTVTITARGYNIGNALCNSTNPNRVERELKTTYGGGSSNPPIALNFDFETGSVGSCPTNWTCTGDAVIASSSDGQGCAVAGNINGSQYLKASCDGTMGTATSQAFTLPSGIDHLRALRAGGADAGTGSGWFVKRVSDGTTLCSAQNGTDSDTFFTDDCTGLSSYVGTSVYIYVIDNQNSGWGKVYLDNIRLMDASNNVLSLPSGADGTGGIITHSGGYTIHTFTSSGT